MTTFNLEMNRGDTAEWTVTALRDGTPINLTGATISMKASRNEASPALFERTSNPGGGITIDNVSGGVLTVKLRPEDTEVLSNQETTLIYAIRVSNVDGEWTIAKGNLKVNPLAGEA